MSLRPFENTTKQNPIEFYNCYSSPVLAWVTDTCIPVSSPENLLHIISFSSILLFPSMCWARSQCHMTCVELNFQNLLWKWRKNDVTRGLEP